MRKDVWCMQMHNILIRTERTAVGRQIKDKNCEERDSDARDDKVDRVKKRLTADCDVKRDVWIRLRAASIIFLILDGWNAKQVPLNARVEVLQLDSNLQRLQITDSYFILDDVLQVNLQRTHKEIDQ